MPILLDQIRFRVNGSCGYPVPGEPGGLPLYLKDGKEVICKESKKKFEKFIASGHLPESVLDEFVFADDPAAVGEAFIDCYHIDTQEGLRFFSDMIRNVIVTK